MRRHLLALGCGLLGMGLALLLWHLWDDHRLIDAIRVAQQQQQVAQAQQIQQFQQQQRQQQPAPAATEKAAPTP